MSKYIAVYVFVLAALGVVALDLLLDDSAEPVNVFTFADNQRETDEKQAAHHRFSAVLQPTISALCKEEIPLKEACANVYAAALAYSPTYLRMLSITESGKGIEEKIAHNLIGHANDRIECAGGDRARRASLQAELRDLFDEAH